MIQASSKEQLDVDDPVQSAKAAGLRYVTDALPGIRRERVGDEFRYFLPDGQPLEDERDLARIQTLGIPPAWTDVWIAPTARGHLQATGRDARGRKQYRYPTRWRQVRDETKYDRMVAFGKALPAIRERSRVDLAHPHLTREKVLAAVVMLLDLTHVRIGNQEYARENETYGLTTMRGEHVDVSGTTIRFHFRGKAGKEHRIRVRDRRLAAVIKRCQALPGQELFQYEGDDGQRHGIDSDDVNEYLRAITGQDFTAKDFRTWAGTVVACCALKECGACETESQGKHNIVQAIKVAADHLGNTPAICRKSYVHPGVLGSYLDGSFLSDATAPIGEATDPSARIQREEAWVLALLERLVPGHQTAA